MWLKRKKSRKKINPWLCIYWNKFVPAWICRKWYYQHSSWSQDRFWKSCPIIITTVTFWKSESDERRSPVHIDRYCRAVNSPDPLIRMKTIVKFYLSGFYKKPKVMIAHITSLSHVSLSRAWKNRTILFWAKSIDAFSITQRPTARHSTWPSR